MKSEINEIDQIPTLTVLDENDVNEFKLIDVRRADEYVGELGHIKNAKLITLGPELSEYLQELKNESKLEEKILFICRSGMRSANSTKEALELGFSNVYNMYGGMIYWNDKKFTKE